MIYGSWASRYNGEAGPLPAEADAATRTLGRDVNVTVLSPKEWNSAKSAFIAHVKDGPLVDLKLAR